MNFENDADFETVRLNELAWRERALKKMGICTHGHRQYHTENTPDIPIGMTKCLECGKIATGEELEDERRENLM